MSSLDDADMKLESAFIFYVNLGLNFYIHMSRGRIYAANMLEGNNPVTYSDFTKYQKIRDILLKMKERCDLLCEDTDLPYVAAGKYIDCMLDECSIMFKFYLSKPIELDDLCYHLDYRETVDKDAFNKLFLPEVPPEDRQDVIDFQAGNEVRQDIMYGQILVYNELGL